MTVCVCVLVLQHESFRQQQTDKVGGDSEVYFLKQTAVNSCGTIALLHAVANNKSKPAFGECTSNKNWYHHTKYKAMHTKIHMAKYLLYKTIRTLLATINDSAVTLLRYFAFIIQITSHTFI